VIEHVPKGVGLERAEVEHDGDENVPLCAAPAKDDGGR
jgi:hypothetical protein